MKKVAPSKIPSMSNVAISGIAISIGLLQAAIAVLQLTPQFGPEFFRDSKISFNAYSSSLTFAHGFVNRLLLGTYLRCGLSFLQLIFAMFLLDRGYLGVANLSKIGNYGLILINSTLLVLQILAGFSIERYGSVMVFLVLLTTRLLLIHQTQVKSKPGVRTRNEGRPKTSTPKKTRSD